MCPVGRSMQTTGISSFAKRTTGSSTMTIPPSTRVLNASIHGGALIPFAGLPVSRSTFQACKGHTTLVQKTIPSDKGPPLCGHRLSTARKRLPRLKIAISRPPAFTGRPSRSGMFWRSVMRIHRPLLFMRKPFPTARFVQIEWDSLANLVPATRRARRASPREVKTLRCPIFLKMSLARALQSTGFSGPQPVLESASAAGGNLIRFPFLRPTQSSLLCANPCEGRA
jgi:hypothetical protein